MYNVCYIVNYIVNYRSKDPKNRSSPTWSCDDILRATAALLCQHLPTDGRTLSI